MTENAGSGSVGPGSAGAAGSELAGAGAAARRRGRPPRASARDTKGALLDAALALFAAHGYEGTSVRAIARSVGLSEGALYAHFDSKRAVFEAALARLGPAAAVAVIDAADPALAAADPAAFVRTLVGRIVDDWSAPQSRQLISLVVQDGLIHDRALTAGMHTVVRALARQFRRWIEAGQVRDGMGSPEDLAYALIAPVALGRVLWLHESAERANVDYVRERVMRHAEFFARAVFDG